MEQNYLVINVATNIVDNVCLWDGNLAVWQPPSGYITIPQAATPAMIWELNENETEYILVEQIGQGQIGFTWDGTSCITNDPKPEPPTQPI